MVEIYCGIGVIVFGGFCKICDIILVFVWYEDYGIGVVWCYIYWLWK